MPQLVRSPEEIFRAEKKDIYFIRGTEEDYHVDAPGLLMIMDWISRELPGTQMELIGPSEHSGTLIGEIGRDLRVDFTPGGLELFCTHWEKNDKSRDDRFQCYVYSYAAWGGSTDVHLLRSRAGGIVHLARYTPPPLLHIIRLVGATQVQRSGD